MLESPLAAIKEGDFTLLQFTCQFCTVNQQKLFTNRDIDLYFLSILTGYGYIENIVLTWNQPTTIPLGSETGGTFLMHT